MVDAGRAKLDAELTRVEAGVDDIGDVQEGFRGYAAFMQAYPAKGIAGIDDDHALAKLSRSECGGISARAAPDDNQIRFLSEFADNHGYVIEPTGNDDKARANSV